MATLNIGYGSRDITPTPPDDAPDAFQVFDRLAFTAMVIQQDEHEMVLLGGDFFSFQTDLRDRTAALVETELGRPLSHLCPAVSHCGGAPILQPCYVHQPCPALRRYGSEDEFARLAAEAILAAFADLKPARIGAAAIPVPGVSYNRRSHNADEQLVMSNFLFPYPRPHLRYDPVDEHVYVLRTDRQTDGEWRPYGATVVFGCHALCNTDRYGHVSADYPGVIRRALTAAWPGSHVCFAQGALGNVVPVQRGGRACERVGNAIAGKALYALEQTTTAEPRLRVHATTIELPLRSVEMLDNTSGVDGMNRLNAYRRDRFVDQQTVSYTLTAAVLGQTTILHLPGEVFVETADAIRGALPTQNVILISGPSADVGYLCPPDAVEAGGMEPQYTVVAGAAEPMVRDAAISLVKHLAYDLEDKPCIPA